MMFYRGTGGLWSCFRDGFGYMSSYMHNGRGFVMMAIGLLVIALIISVIVILVRKSNRSRTVLQNDDSIELLNVRFAKGEITEEDYLRMKKVLSGK